MKRPIALSLSPNTQGDDVKEAIKTIVMPWLWKRGKEENLVAAWFRRYFETNDIVLFNSGRSALFAILKAFNIGAGDEVLVQAFTCVAVPNAVLWTEAKPIFLDIDTTYNVDCKLIEKSITKRTRAIIVQHTFGIPANIDLIKKITQKKGILLIEDCAHAIGAEVDGKKLGTFGDAAICSFGRDKVISSVFGGLAIMAKKHKKATEKLQHFRHELPYPSFFWIFQQLLHPIAFWIILPLYKSGEGKLLLFLLQQLGLLSKPVYEEEKCGARPNDFPTRFPNALARLLLVQVKKLAQYNKTRRDIATIYDKRIRSLPFVNAPVYSSDAIYMRFPIEMQERDEFLLFAKKRGILLGNWYHNTIDPKGVDWKAIGYNRNCLKAEKCAKHIVNLPTYPLLERRDIKDIIDLFHAYADTRNR